MATAIPWTDRKHPLLIVFISRMASMSPKVYLYSICSMTDRAVVPYACWRGCGLHASLQAEFESAGWLLADVTMMPQQPSASQSRPQVHADLLGGDDLLGSLGDLSMSTMPTPQPQPSLELRATPSLSPADFQAKWGSWQPSLKFDLALSQAAKALIQPSSLQVEAHQNLCILVHMKAYASNNFPIVWLEHTSHGVW